MPSPASIQPARAAFYGWRILAFATLTAALTGPGQTVGVSVFIDHIILDLDLTRSQVSTAYLIGTMLGAMALPSVGRWVDRIGARHAITAIGSAFALSLVAMSSVANFVTLAIGFTFIRFLGQGSLTLASTVAVTQWFRRNRGLALGIFATGTSMLMGLSPLALNFAIDTTTWRTAWVIAAGAILLTVVPIGRFGIVSYPSDIGEVPDGLASQPDREESALPIQESYTRAEAVRTARFWIMLTAAAVAGAWITALNFHQISLLGEAGLSASTAALMFLPQVVGASLSALAFGTLADRVSARVLIPVSMGLLAGAQLLVTVVAPGLLVVVYVVALGLAGGAIRSIGAAMLPKWYGTAHIGAIAGLMTFAGVVGSAVGPVTFSLGRDWLGGYASTAATLAALPIAVAVASLLLLARGD